MKGKGLRKLPKDLAKAVIATALENYDRNSDKIDDKISKEAYMLGYLHGFEGAWAMYTDEDDEIMRRYGEDDSNN